MAAPSYDIDFFDDAVIQDPWPHYAAMRQLGPVVWLPRHDNFALTRHQEVRAALQDPKTFCSGQGVAADDFGCSFLQGNTVASDGQRHKALRSAMAPPLLPGALAAIQDHIDSVAEDVIDGLVTRGSFDAVTDLARQLPLAVVRDLVGLPDFGQDRMLAWAAAAFDVLGIQNDRGGAALPVIAEMRGFIRNEAKPENLKPDSWTHRVMQLSASGQLCPELAPFAVRDYINPSLDTTISATSQLIFQLGRNPNQWEHLKNNPALAINAVNEAVRLATPIRSFSRHATKDVDIAGVTIPKGARVMMLFASANRDEDVFPNPDQFDLTRDPKLHVGFGSGPHMCVGMHLAQMEMQALIKAMIPRVGKIEIGQPIIALNNTISALAKLPTQFEAENRVLTVDMFRPKAAQHKLLSGVVRLRTTIAQGIDLFEIWPLDGEHFPDAEPGAHIDIHIEPGLVRQYSLTGPPQRDVYRIAVQKEPYSSGGSLAMHARFDAGSKITIGMPRNNFPLNTAANDVLLLGGGIGVTPLIPMAWRLHQMGKSFSLHIAARSEARLPFAEALPGLPFADRLFVHIDDGPDATPTYLDAVLSGAARESEIYICGPAGFMVLVQTKAMEQGFAEGQLHVEHFGAEIDSDGDSFTLVAAHSQKTIEVGPNETILAALEGAGVAVATSCRNGVCGTCLTPVVDGVPDHRDLVLTDIEKAANRQIAVCCSRSKSKTLVLDI